MKKFELFNCSEGGGAKFNIEFYREFVAGLKTTLKADCCSNISVDVAYQYDKDTTVTFGKKDLNIVSMDVFHLTCTKNFGTYI